MILSKYTFTYFYAFVLVFVYFFMILHFFVYKKQFVFMIYFNNFGEIIPASIKIQLKWKN